MPSIKYLIYTKRGFDKTSGGNILLHKLCHDLRMIGQDAYISHGPSGPNFNAPQYCPSASELKNEFVVVYPETRMGNPLHCPRVVRWILNTPGAFGPTDFYKREKKSDLIFKLSTFYDYTGKGYYKGILYTIFVDFEAFKNLNLKRSGSCYLVRKGKIINKVHDENSVLIADAGDWKVTPYLFNTKEVFYCYDTATYLSLLAALCGCICLVVPDEKKPSNEWHACWPHNKFGIAYGNDELDHARKTLDLVAGHLRNMEQKGLESVNCFAEIVNHHFVSVRDNMLRRL
jgi:hypothetical protein